MEQGIVESINVGKSSFGNITRNGRKLQDDLLGTRKLMQKDSLGTKRYIHEGKTHNSTCQNLEGQLPNNNWTTSKNEYAPNGVSDQLRYISGMFSLRFALLCAK